MRYTILVQNEKDPKLFKFLTVKEPVMKEIKTEVTDEETQEVKEVITYLIIFYITALRMQLNLLI